MQLVHASPREGPLLTVVPVNDVANVADKNDALLVQIGSDPIGPTLEYDVSQRAFLVFGRTLRPATPVMLGIRNDND